ncbi:alpha/beta hydrolase [Nocardia sp. NPDC050630]|uniref:alpha/beta hydrolase n=1 Tax=Nocardia sp. NPDC050630 TaxID=3364321 RepID=UPI0037978697
MPNLTAGGVRWLATAFASLLSTTIVGATSAGGDPIAADCSPVTAQVSLKSAAMNRFVPVRALRPAEASTPRPTLCLLDGADGAEIGSGWVDRTDAAAFFADKNVNVVSVSAGRTSYGTDWQWNDPALDSNKWATYLTRELPPVIDAHGPSSDRDVAGDPIVLADRVVIGGGFESNGCTRRLAAELSAAGVPARIVFRPTGTHAWGYRQDALHDSWPMFAVAIGA